MGATLRVLTLNLWGEQPPLERRLTIVQEYLAAEQPDVVALQEVREVPEKLPNQAATLAEALGYHHVYAPATAWGGGVEGVALLCRSTILESDEAELPCSTPTERRVVLWAQCETAVGPVSLYTTHLNYRLTDGMAREAQVVAVDDFVKAHETELPQILMGDFNATPAHDEIRFLRGETSLAGRRTCYQDAFARLHPDNPGWTWAARNPYTASLAWLGLDRRLDYVFVTPERSDGRGRIRSCHIVLSDAASDGAFASDHFGVAAEIVLARRS